MTCFFETLHPWEYASRYDAFDDAYAYIFNSYYRGRRWLRHPRTERGFLSRPGYDEVAPVYRSYVDEAMDPLLRASRSARSRRVDHPGVAP